MIRLLALLSIALLAIPASAQVTLENNSQWLEDLIAPGNAAANNLFGSSIVVGNFDDDPYGEVAVAAPYAEVAGQAEAGRIYILQGDDTGFVGFGSVIDRSVANVERDPLPYNNFGRVLAVGDFDGNGFDDLAVGVGLDSTDAAAGGSVQVFYATASGLSFSSPDDQIWDSADLGSPVEASRGFGWTLAVGDFDGDDYDDLAISSKDINDGSGAGSVHVLYGTMSGLSITDAQTLRQGLGGLTDTREADDDFGSALGVGDFDGDGYDDLAVGVEGEHTIPDGDNGAVHLIFGGAGGLSGAGDRLLRAVDFGGDSPGSRLGFGALAGCDLDQDGDDELILGVPFDDTEAINGGAVYIIPGSPAGPVDAEAQAINLENPGINISAADHGNFGAELAAADFDGDGRCDLAASISGYTLLTEYDGLVVVLSDLLVAPNPTTQFLYEDLSTPEGDVVGAGEIEDFFGFALAAGRVDSDRLPDLLIGSLEDLAVGTDAGAFHLFFGDARLFADGFESGDTLGWSSTEP